MVDKIHEIKSKVIEKIDKNIRERGIERIDIAEMSMLVDIVKDLAEAEKECWMGDYYRKVSESMGGSQSQGYSVVPSGYGGGTGSSAGYGSMRGGYSQRSGHEDTVDMVKMKMMSMDQQERERFRNEINSMMGAM